MKLDNYKKGAVAGGIIGFVCSSYFNKSRIIGAILGIVAGGYIANLITSSTKKTITKTEFKRQKP